MNAQAVATPPMQLDATEAARRTLHRRAVEAAVWAMPVVGVEAMRQAFFCDARATYNDILFWSRAGGWKNQTPTPDPVSCQAYFNFNTKRGPVVFIAPPGGGVSGSIFDAWQVPVADVGADGSPDGERRYVLLPPGHAGPVPAGYVPVRLQTFNGYAMLRVAPAGADAAALRAAVDTVRQLQVHPLSEAALPPRQRFVDMTGRLFDGVVPSNERLYAHLARMLSEEPALQRGAAVLGGLRGLGIEPGGDFRPDAVTRAHLRRAAADAQAIVTGRGATGGVVLWPGFHWRSPGPVGARRGFSLVANGRPDAGGRTEFRFFAAAPPTPGAATFSLSTYCDGAGHRLGGEHTYHLRVPACVPAARRWSVAVYDAGTGAFIRESPRAAVDSHGALERNADGSVDLCFGPEPRACYESNWIYTAPGRPWFTIFRFQGPEAPLFEKTWWMGDVERVR